MIDLYDIALRIVTGLVCGMIIGIDRSRQNKATGVRTLGLVGLGAALVTTGAVQLSASDPASISRIVQGILAGIGFLGAGVILHGPHAHHAHGLTTAAAIWLVAILGVLAGQGEWPLALAGLLVGFILLSAGENIEKWVRSEGETPASGGPPPPEAHKKYGD